MSDPEKPEVAAKPRRDPAALSSEYHKAHKQLLLWSGVLFTWALIGIDLEVAKEAGGTVGPIVKALRSPQAVPWALVILVLYFSFKCSVEWAQCSPNRRQTAVARIDFISAWLIATSAIALYVGQALTQVQFANFVQDPERATPTLIGFFTGGVVGSITVIVFAVVHEKYRDLAERLAFVTLLSGSAAMMALLSGTIRRPFSWRFFSYSLLVGSILFGLVSIVYVRLAANRKLPKNS